MYGLPAGPVIGAGEDFPRRDGQQRLWRPDRDGQVMDVRVGDPAGDDLPRIATVLAVPDAVHFEAGPDVLMVYRIDQQGSHPGNAHVGALLGHCHGQLIPMLAAILGTEQRCRPGAREDDVGVDRVDGEGPDGELIHGRVQPLPVLAFILTTVHAAVRATVQNTRISGMYRQGAHRAFTIDAVADPQPGLSAIAAPPDTLSKSPYTDGGMFRHCLSPSVAYAVSGVALTTRRVWPGLQPAAPWACLPSGRT